jgi:hypothetical protein
MASQPAPEDVMREQLLDFCQVSKRLARHEEHTLHRLVEVVKTQLKSKCLDLLQNNPEQAVLWSFQSDATSLKTAARTVSSGQGSQVTRRGRVLREVLLQRGFLKTKSTTGEEQMAIMISDVLLLSAGKKTWNMFSAAARFFPLPRKSGHKGIVVQHFCADRAIFTALDRRLRQRSQAFYTEGLGPDLGDERLMLELTDWSVSTGCVCHDAHNALKWGLSRHTSPDELRGLHVVMESLRNSFAILVERLPAFLGEFLVFDSSGFDMDEVLGFWRCLGVEADMLEEVAAVNPWWADGRLCVNGALAGDSEAAQKVSHVLLYLFKWRLFTESRWITLGPACRSLLWGLCVGLDHLVAFTRKDPQATDYHLHGYVNLTAPLKKYAILASVASNVPDAVLAELLVDDRVALRAGELRQLMMDELAWAHSIPPFVWARLASLLDGMEEWELKHQALHACHVAASYLQSKVFSVVGSFPWKLVSGDIVANLQALASSDEPIRDSCTHKIRTLLGLGYSMDKLVEGAALLREAQWSTTVVEQAHGSAAVMHRHHPDYSDEMLATRSTLHQCRALFQSDLEASKEGARQARLQALRSKNPYRVSGRHAFLGTLVQAASEALPSGSKLPQSFVRDAVKQHSKMFSLLSPEQQAAYHQEALEKAHAKGQALKGDVRQLQDDAQLRKSRSKEESLATGLLNRTSMARFTPQDYERLVSIDRSLDRSAASVSTRRKEALSAPEVPPADVRAALQQVPIYAAPLLAHVLPEWLKRVCHNREHMEDVVLTTSLEEGSKGAFFLFASKKPFGAAFLSVVVASATMPCMEELQPPQNSGVPWHTYRFEPEMGSYIFEDELPFDDPAQVMVLQDVTFEGSGSLVSCMPPVALPKFVASLPKQAREPTKRSSAKKGDDDSDEEEALPILVEEPLQEESQEEADEAPERVTKKARNESDTLPDFLLDMVWQELAEKRKELLDSSASGTDFVAVLRGGAWSATYKGVSSYAMDAKAKVGEPSAFCKRYGLNKLASFSFGAHGEKGAASLAVEWCRRMQHFYNQWSSQPSASYAFTEADVAAYQPSDSWLEFKAGLPLQGPTRDRAVAIDSIAPGVPK